MTSSNVDSGAVIQWLTTRFLFFSFMATMAEGFVHACSRLAQAD